MKYVKPVKTSGRREKNGGHESHGQEKLIIQ